jgi:hypothetical protein
MEPAVIVPSAEVGPVLEEIRHAFARNETGAGIELIEHALDLGVEWEALTRTVDRGIADGRAPSAGSARVH